MRHPGVLSGLAATLLPPLLPLGVNACGGGVDCYGPGTVEHVRQVKRMQPGAVPAAYGPKGPLEWGQVNFLHTVRELGSSWGAAVAAERWNRQIRMAGSRAISRSRTTAPIGATLSPLRDA